VGLPPSLQVPTHCLRSFEIGDLAEFGEWFCQGGPDGTDADLGSEPGDRFRPGQPTGVDLDSAAPWPGHRRVAGLPQDGAGQLIRSRRQECNG
jgi:hypothetical protein